MPKPCLQGIGQMKTDKGIPDRRNSMDRGSEAQRQFRVGRDLTPGWKECGSGPSGQKALCHKGILLEVPVLHLECQRWSLGGVWSQELI